MRFRYWGAMTSLTTVVLAIAGGCGSSGSPPADKGSSTEAKVSGKVTYNGKPVSGGKVTVDSSGPSFVERVADNRADGSYEITTFIGKNAFSVRGTGTPAEVGTYNKANFEVKAGPNTIDLALPLADK